jgi:GLPGLI family protein
MIRLFYLCGFLSILCINVKAQKSETIKVKYTETMYLEQKGDMPPQMAANMPKSRNVNKILYATPGKSIYIVNKEDKAEEVEDRARGRGMRKRGVDPIVYCNYETLKMVTFTDFFGKEFLINEEKEYAWKIHSGEQRDILGYTCIKATYQRDSTLVTVWYTPKIQLSVGPDGYSGLPGLILAVAEGEKRVTLATVVEEKSVNPPAIEEPTKGEVVTREKFNEIRIAKTKEMKEMWGGNQRGMMRG